MFFASIVNFVWGSTLKKCITVAVGTAAVTGGGFWLWFRKEIAVAKFLAKTNGTTVDSYYEAAKAAKKAAKGAEKAAKAAQPAAQAAQPAAHVA